MQLPFAKIRLSGRPHNPTRGRGSVQTQTPSTWKPNTSWGGIVQGAYMSTLSNRQYSAMQSAMSRAARPWLSAVPKLVEFPSSADNKMKFASAAAYWLFLTIVKADKVLKSLRNLIGIRISNWICLPCSPDPETWIEKCNRVAGLTAPRHTRVLC